MLDTVSAGLVVIAAVQTEQVLEAGVNIEMLKFLAVFKFPVLPLLSEKLKVLSAPLFINWFEE